VAIEHDKHNSEIPTKFFAQL